MNSTGFIGTWTLDQVKTAIASKPDLLFDRDSNARTPMLVSCFAKNWEVAKYLVENGADVTAQDKFGANALIFACMMGKYEFARLLVSRGADLNAKNTLGRDALSFVTDESTKADLLALAANTTHHSTSDKSYAAGRGVPIEPNRANGHRESSSTAKTSIPAVSTPSVLFPSAPSSAPSTPVTKPAQAPMSSSKGISSKVATPDPQDIHGRTPLISACWKKSWEEVRTLIANGADVMAKDNYGATPLIVVCLSGQIDLAVLLLEKGAELYSCNNVGRDALSFISNEKDRKLLQTTYDTYRKANVNERSDGFINSPIEAKGIENGSDKFHLRGNLDKFVSTDSWAGSPPNSARLPILHSKSAIAAFDSPSVTVQREQAELRANAAAAIIAATAESRKPAQSNVTLLEQQNTKTETVGNLQSRQNTTSAVDTPASVSIPAPTTTPALALSAPPKVGDDIVRVRRPAFSTYCSDPTALAAPLLPPKQVGEELNKIYNPSPSGRNSSSKDRPALVSAPSSVSDDYDDPEVEDQRLVRLKETELRRQLLVLTDLDDLIEPSHVRTRLITRIRTRIAEIERALHSLNSHSTHTSGHNNSSSNGSAGSPDGKKRVELDESAAIADIRSLRQSRLRQLVADSMEDEIIAREFDSLTKKIFFGIKALATEEQVDTAPSLAVVLYNKSRDEFRLFFVCSYTLRILPCGFDGEGFSFRKSFPWVRSAIPCIKFCMYALRCGIIQHSFGHTSDYSDLCSPASCRVYLNDIIENLRELDASFVEEDVASVISANSTSSNANLWDLFGTLSCASSVIGFTGKFMLDTLDSSVGTCARVFGSDNLTRISVDPDIKFRVAIKDLPNAADSFLQMLNSEYRSDNWKQTHFDNFNLDVLVDSRGVFWIDKSEQVIRAFESEAD